MRLSNETERERNSGFCQDFEGVGFPYIVYVSSTLGFQYLAIEYNIINMNVCNCNHNLIFNQ